jgi:hypothetical protein
VGIVVVRPEQTSADRAWPSLSRYRVHRHQPGRLVGPATNLRIARSPSTPRPSITKGALAARSLRRRHVWADLTDPADRRGKAEPSEAHLTEEEGTEKSTE